MATALEVQQAMSPTHGYPPAHLLGIPPELRLIIYDYLFPPPDVKSILEAEKVSASSNPRGGDLHDRFRNLHPHAPMALAPLLTGRLIEQEAWRQAFRNTVFSVNVSQPMSRCCPFRRSSSDQGSQLFKPLHDMDPATRRSLRHLQLTWREKCTVMSSSPSRMTVTQSMVESESTRMLQRLLGRIPLELAELGLRTNPATSPATEYILEKTDFEMPRDAGGSSSVSRLHLRLFVVCYLQVQPLETRDSGAPGSGPVQTL